MGHPALSCNKLISGFHFLFGNLFLVHKGESQLNWNTAYQRIRQLQGQDLDSISGKSDIRLLSINPDRYVVQRTDGSRVSRPTGELRAIANEMALNVPLHVDAFLRGGRTSRNQPETILANLRSVECRRINRRKHIVWVGRNTHPLGTLRRS